MTHLLPFCYRGPLSWYLICIVIHTVPVPVMWRKSWTWEGSVCIVNLPAHSLLFLFFSCRKHALNCHRMKPALFSVLCEIKEKTGEFLLHYFFVFSCLHKFWYMVCFFSLPPYSGILKNPFISCKTVHVPNIPLFYICIVLIGICTTNVNYFCALL